MRAGRSRHLATKEYEISELDEITNLNSNSLETRDQLGRLWKLEVTDSDPNHQEWEFTLPDQDSI